MKTGPPLVFRSASFERKLRTIRQLADQTLGQVEIALEIGGAVQGRAVVAVDCLIPVARVRPAFFKVDDRDLSECWANAEKDPETRHLSPVGDLHFHPGLGRPTPSPVDRQNSTRQAGLYHVFNLKDVQLSNIFAPRLENDRWVYRIDDWRDIVMLPSGADPPMPICIEETRKISLWASLIYPANAHPKKVSASVVEHAYLRDDPDSVVTRHSNVVTRVIRDKALARILDWPIERVCLQIDESRLRSEIEEKYQAEGNSISPAACPVSVQYGYNTTYPLVIRSNTAFLNGG